MIVPQIIEFSEKISYSINHGQSLQSWVKILPQASLVQQQGYHECSGKVKEHLGSGNLNILVSLFPSRNLFEKFHSLVAGDRAMTQMHKDDFE